MSFLTDKDMNDIIKNLAVFEPSSNKLNLRLTRKKLRVRTYLKTKRMMNKVRMMHFDLAFMALV